ncbi:MAG: glycoside hydrolase family 92 protein, partial [Bacteroides sp.]|nr:glycoside hydrolase family 92 protein [Bacteroides sp.]
MITYRLYKHLLLAGILLLVTSCSVQPVKESSARNTQWVDPYIGTGDHGHVFLGANVPFGFVQLGPTEYTRGWDWCSGYHYSDSVLLGFSHMHLSGTGIGDLGDILFLPTISREKKEARYS